jgi:predicted RNase H-like HicB family nuclease
MPQFIGLIHKEPDRDYGVSFPEFPGVITAGSTLDEARALAEEALGFHIEGLAEHGEAIPEPSSLDVVMADPENGDGVAVLVAVGASPSRSVRVNVTLPQELLAEIDRYAKQHGLTRSRFLAHAAKGVSPARPGTGAMRIGQ